MRSGVLDMGIHIARRAFSGIYAYCFACCWCVMKEKVAEEHTAKLLTSSIVDGNRV